MPRKLDNDTRMHFRTFQDEAHAQKRAFCLHCNSDACADNIQRMKNHLLKCEPYLAGHGNVNEPIYQLQMDGSLAPDNSVPGMGSGQQSGVQSLGPVQDGSNPGPSHSQQQQQQQQQPQQHPPQEPQQPQQDPGSTAIGMQSQHSQQDPNATQMSMQPPPSPANNNNDTVPPRTPAAMAAATKLAQNQLEKVRQGMGRSTRRLEGLEAVLKTQVQDGMHNAATHVRAAMRDERDRLFKLSQQLVKQEMKLREAQNIIGTF